MGLDATVMCTCLRDGTITEPPFPREWLTVDDEEYVCLKGEHDSDANWRAFDRWMLSCCRHEGMNLACQRIGNWASYRLFQSTLAEIGWRHFPVLKQELPNLNGGLTPAEASVRALRELAAFESTALSGFRAVLVETATGLELYEHIPVYEGVFVWSGRRGMRVGISERDFFAIDAASGRDLFRTPQFRQFRQNGEPIEGEDDEVMWEDLETGGVYASGIAISGRQIPWDDGSWETADGRCRFAYPSEMHVEHRPRRTDDSSPVVQALRAVFEASVASGNPVRWC